MADLVGFRDDLDGTEGAPPAVDRYHFAFGRADQMVTWEIDLSQANYTRLEAALEEFLAAAREPTEKRVKPAVRRRSPNGTRQAQPSKAATEKGTSMAEVRKWLQENHAGSVSDRGRLSASAQELWNTNHPKDRLR